MAFTGIRGDIMSELNRIPNSHNLPPGRYIGSWVSYELSVTLDGPGRVTMDTSPKAVRGWCDVIIVVTADSVSWELLDFDTATLIGDDE